MSTRMTSAECTCRRANYDAHRSRKLSNKDTDGSGSQGEPSPEVLYRMLVRINMKNMIEENNR